MWGGVIGGLVWCCGSMLCKNLLNFVGFCIHKHWELKLPVQRSGACVPARAPTRQDEWLTERLIATSRKEYEMGWILVPT